MIRFALDTDTLSLLHGGHTQVMSQASAAVPYELGITPISIEEQVNGRIAFIRRARRPDLIESGYHLLAITIRFLASFQVLPYTQAAIARFEALKRMKLNVGGNDLRIAAIALEAGAIVVSRNVRDFGRVPGLVVEDWSVPSGP